MGQYISTQPCATGLHRSVCTTFVLGDENGHSYSNKKGFKVGTRGRNPRNVECRSLPEGSS
jgi:hypothetical protein